MNGNNYDENNNFNDDVDSDGFQDYDYDYAEEINNEELNSNDYDETSDEVLD